MESPFRSNYRDRTSGTEVETDGLKSYRAAFKDLTATRKQEMGRRLNNRVENSHLTFRRRERAMQRFRQMKTLQKFNGVHAAFHNHFNLERHLISRLNFKAQRSAALAEWKSLAI
ncbi:DDE-type integrase/transposase/recombinase [Brevundimonas subvibrioides]|uniref:DDE-type integrase/transposase/recombinase n=1 Tax=Brevundimonas subvibrioides TaxID=74313 RepID=UPI0022B37D0E|nr:DDE-type integrase/transposase/recombinase [Brevundimonas subvibrioides]